MRRRSRRVRSRRTCRSSCRRRSSSSSTWSPRTRSGSRFPRRCRPAPIGWSA